MQCQVGVLLVLGFLAEGVLACGPCTCSLGHAEQPTATCFDLKNLTSVPTSLPQDIKELYITSCFGITTLKQNEFASLSNLEVISLRDGGLRSIESHAFRGLINVTTIDLNNNSLINLSDDIFSDTPNVVEVHLSNNKLQILTQNLFANLKHLIFVSFASNKIQFIASHSFVNVPVLQELSLYDNRLTSLKLDFIDNTCNLKSLNLEKNPWICDASLCGVMEMVLQRELGDFFPGPICIAPSKLSGSWINWRSSPLLTTCRVTEQCNGQTPDTGTSMRPTETCSPSVTTINGGKAVCGGTIIFEDNFNNVNESKWEKQYYIADEPDFEFVTYEKQNIDSENGFLNLIVSLRNNVESVHSLDFTNGCTDVTCTRKIPGQLMPPVIAGQVKSKFSFRYGKIEIKAQLPKGDWVYPQLYLETRDPTEVYNNNSRIWLAYSRGNSDLRTKTQEQIGNTVLYAGPVLSTRESDRYSAVRVFNMQRGGKWSDAGHTFTYTWTPDVMIVAVDGDSVSILTTYNKELQVTLGIAAGGLTGFPDDSQSGPHVKPWKKTTYQTNRVFYENRNNWLPTWSNGTATLQIDSIKIWAL